jgi:hypothetical protein
MTYYSGFQTIVEDSANDVNVTLHYGDEIPAGTIDRDVARLTGAGHVSVGVPPVTWDGLPPRTA